MKRMSLGVLFLLVACGQQSGGGEKFGAPTEQSQAGVIASCTSKTQAVTVAQKLGGSFRVLNEKRGLIEFYDIDAQSLESELPRAKFTHNQVYEQLLDQEIASSFSFGDFPYVGPGQVFNRTAAQMSYFPHLVQIDGFDLPANTQGQGITIAVVDSGVHYNHPHLSPNIRINARDAHGSASNGVDDDQNGFADDYAGWDFYNHDAYPIDDNGHGTHVAGLAAGMIGGVAPKARILPVKVLSASGSGDLATIAAGVLYAIDNGADVVNLSLGGPASGVIGPALENLIKHIQVAKERNITIVAAAGNGNEDGIGDCNEDFPVWPASIESDNLMAVAAVNSSDQLTAYSNFSPKSVHVAAPGGEGAQGLLSTVIPNCTTNCSNQHAVYGRMSGTSMASPVVSGIVALVKSARASMSSVAIRTHLMTHGKPVRELQGVIRSGQVVNVKEILRTL